MAAIRTFLAFDTPETVKESILSVQTELKRSGLSASWESRGKLHVTIKFLGNVESGILGDVIARCESICTSYPPFVVVYAGIGAFPSPRHPRVLWAGCENPDGTLDSLKRDLDAGLTSFGFPVESRTFRPHVTVCRIRDERKAGNLTPMLESLTFEPRSSAVDGIIVMKSVLEPQGARYSALQHIHLHH